MTFLQTWSDYSWSGIARRLTSFAFRLAVVPGRAWYWNLLIGLLLIVPWTLTCLLITFAFSVWWMLRSRHAFVGALCGMVLASLGGLILLQSYVVSPLGVVTDKIPVLNLLRNRTADTYIERWSETAIGNMKKYGIPASVILAQGMLESDYGTSALTIEARNHFGIKCHKGWKGAGSYRTDDKPNECFRKYRDDEESFEDHSRFLLKNKRYASLFKLDPKNYKAWAKGLKAAGYATDRLYANKLIGMIERYNLDRFDHE